MIYLDNAATTFKKPSSVYRAVYKAMTEFGANAGRGGHKLSAKAGEIVYETREILAEFFKVPSTERIAFFPNATYALNAAIFGCLKNGGHVITTQAEHNSVIRPLAELERRKRLSFSVIEGDKRGRIDMDKLKGAFRPDTRLVIVTGASNVCGNIYDTEKAARICHKHGALILVDAAQTAGVLDIDAKKYDMMAFAGHKGLMGPLGTGGLYVAESVTLEPFASGGTGSKSESVYQPRDMPDLLESGTLNMPALAGLYEGVRFIQKEGIGAIDSHERELARFAYEHLQNMNNITCYGDMDSAGRVGVLSFNVEGMDSVRVANEMSEKYNIAVRGGLHCAPMAHKMLKTEKTGTVRLSFGYFNTKAEVKRAIDAIYKIQKELS